MVLSDPDIPWEDISPRPRRQRQQVKQVHVPRRRVNSSRTRRDSSADSRASSATQRSKKSAAQAHQKRADNFVRPTALPPFSQHRRTKRTRDDDDGDETEDTVAKRTRSRAGEKRSAEPGIQFPEPKRWRKEQVLLLQFVSSYFCATSPQK